MVPIVRLANDMHLAETGEQEPPDVQSCLNRCLDSVSLLTSSNLHIDQLRRDKFKPALPTGYKCLANEPEVHTEWLFGDLEKRIKEADEKLKVEQQLKEQEEKTKPRTVQLTPRPNFVRPYPYNNNNNNNNNNKAYSYRNSYTPSTRNQPRNNYNNKGSSNLRRFPKTENLHLASTSGKQAQKKWQPKR